MTEDAQLAPVHRARVIKFKLNEIAESSGADPELIALAATVATFEQLTSTERARAVEYVRSRYGKPEPSY